MFVFLSFSANRSDNSNTSLIIINAQAEINNHDLELRAYGYTFHVRFAFANPIGQPKPVSRSEYIH
jgi:hypothetical protein